MRRFSSVASAVALTVGLLVAPAFAAPALADSLPSRDPAPVVPDTSDSAPASPPAVMGDYSAESFSAEAQTLDPGLLAAVADDLGISGEQYLADGAAAVDASYVVDDLQAAGHAILGSRIDGTQLTVYVGSDDAAAAAEAAGAAVVYGAPERPDVDTSGYQPLSDLYAGQGWYYQDDTYRYQCSVGFNGYDTQTSAAQFATAGHCVPAGTTIVGQIGSLNLAHPGDPISDSNRGPAIGLPVPGSFQFGDDLDSGLVNISEPGWTMKPQVLNWGGSKGGPLQSAPVNVTDTRPAVVGASLCKSGSRTGWSCGTILRTDVAVKVDTVEVNEIIATTCADHGDSGGAAVMGTAAVGITSAGPAEACTTPGYSAAYFPMISSGGWGSIQSSHPSWEPVVTVATPVVTNPANGAKVLQGGALTGTLANGNATNVITVTIAGDPSSPHTVAVGADGQWTLNLSTVPLGSHSYTAKASWKTLSSSPTISGSLTVVANPAVDRLSGADRYAVGVAVAQRAYPDSASVVYISTGENYPDALSAAPAAVKEGGPLLLTTTTFLPESVRDEIVHLKPTKIVVVGGPNSVSPAVYNELATLATNIHRVTGADRFAVSRALVAYAFGSASSAYVTTGTNFPDALSASAAGGMTNTPVLLVNGADQTVDQPTRSALQGLGVKSIKVAGGPNSVSEGIKTSLGTIAPTIRLTGADRFASSVAINRDAFSTAPTVYLTTGYNFPDALAGAALAGMQHAPVYMVGPQCVPSAALADIARFESKKVTLLGGPATLLPSVESLTSCTF